MSNFEVIVGAGTLRAWSADAVHFPHRWTDEGVSVEATFTGAHLLHLAAAGCVLNDVYREAAQLGVRIDGVRVSCAGDYNTETWQSSGITYRVELDSPGSDAEQAELLNVVDAVAEIPKALRAGASVNRSS